MSDGLLGVLVGFIIFGIGLTIGSLGGRKRTKEWLEENGCYLCQEKHKNPFDM